MTEPVRHRQAQGAATDMFDLPPPRHTSTLPVELVPTRIANGGYEGKSRQASTTQCEPFWAAPRRSTVR